MPKSEDQRLSVRPIEKGNKYVNTALISVFNIWYWLKPSRLLWWYCASLWSSCLSVNHSAARKISHGLWWSLIQKWNNRRWFYDLQNCSRKTNTPHKSTPHRGVMYLPEPGLERKKRRGLRWVCDEYFPPLKAPTVQSAKRPVFYQTGCCHGQTWALRVQEAAGAELKG